MDATSSDPRIFFQIAAALIPALVFGGLISQKATPRKHWSRGPTWRTGAAAMVAIVAGLAVFLAEVDAIVVALTGDPSREQAWTVSIVVVVATAVTIGAVVWPWLSVIFEIPTSVRMLALSAGFVIDEPISRRVRVCFIVVVVLAGLALAYQSARLLSTGVSAVQRAHLTEELIRQRQLQIQLSEEQIRSYNRNETGRVLEAFRRDLRARSAAGLFPRRTARRVEACFADMAYKSEFRTLLDVGQGESSALAKLIPKLLPGKSLRCRTVLRRALKP